MATQKELLEQYSAKNGSSTSGTSSSSGTSNTSSNKKASDSYWLTDSAADYDPYAETDWLSTALGNLFGFGGKGKKDAQAEQVSELQNFGWVPQSEDGYTYDDWIAYKKIKDAYAGGDSERKNLTILGDFINDLTDSTIGNAAAGTDNSMAILKNYYNNVKNNGMDDYLNMFDLDESGNLTNNIDLNVSDNYIKGLSEYSKDWLGGDGNFANASSSDITNILKQYIGSLGTYKDENGNDQVDTSSLKNSSGRNDAMEVLGIDYNPTDGNYARSGLINGATLIASFLPIVGQAANASKISKSVQLASKGANLAKNGIKVADNASDAAKVVNKATDKVTNLTNEYNKLVNAGADAAKIANQEERINKAADEVNKAKQALEYLEDVEALGPVKGNSSMFGKAAGNIMNMINNASNTNNKGKSLMTMLSNPFNASARYAASQGNNASKGLGFLSTLKNATDKSSDLNKGFKTMGLARDLGALGLVDQDFTDTLGKIPNHYKSANN